jgi:uncharacterized protein with HEPN domain
LLVGGVPWQRGDAFIYRQALSQLAKISPAVAAKIPELSQAVAFRNRLIHGYTNVDDAIVWRTVQHFLPQLRERLAALLTELGGPP